MFEREAEIREDLLSIQEEIDSCLQEDNDYSSRIEELEEEYESILYAAEEELGKELEF